jgi:hypothetical protein
MAKIKKLQKKPAKPIKKVKKTRKMIVETFLVYGFVIKSGTFVTMVYNDLVYLAQLLEDDKTTLWFALDEGSDELKDWKKIILQVAKSTFNNDVESTIIDFQTYFANKKVSFLNLVNAALKLPKSKINDLLIAKMASTFKLEFDDWCLQTYLKP